MFILTFLKQGPTICMHRVCMYAYFYLHTHDFAHVYFDTYSHCFLMIFQISGSYNFTLFKNSILYFWTFHCLSLKERGSLLLSFVLKKPYFPFFSYKLFNKYFSLRQNAYQFSVSVWKKKNSYVFVHHSHNFII